MVAVVRIPRAYVFLSAHLFLFLPTSSLLLLLPFPVPLNSPFPLQTVVSFSFAITVCCSVRLFWNFFLCSSSYSKYRADPIQPPDKKQPRTSEDEESPRLPPFSKPVPQPQGGVSGHESSRCVIFPPLPIATNRATREKKKAKSAWKKPRSRLPRLLHS